MCNRYCPGHGNSHGAIPSARFDGGCARARSTPVNNVRAPSDSPAMIYAMPHHAGTSRSSKFVRSREKGLACRAAILSLIPDEVRTGVSLIMGNGESQERETLDHDTKKKINMRHVCCVARFIRGDRPTNSWPVAKVAGRSTSHANEIASLVSLWEKATYSSASRPRG